MSKNKHKILLDKIYQHYKGGRYIILHIADDSTNNRLGNKLVVYLSLKFGVIKCRDLNEFTELIKWPDGKKRPRFIIEK